MTSFDAQVHCFILEPPPATRCTVCSPPLMHVIDGRNLTEGVVFLHDGQEHTVTWFHHERIRCAREVHTDKGARIYFTKFSPNVTVIL